MEMGRLVSTLVETRSGSEDPEAREVTEVEESNEEIEGVEVRSRLL